MAIPGRGRSGAANGGSAASLLFVARCRPDADAIRRAAAGEGDFSISFDPAEAGGEGAAPTDERGAWLELLANGLTFDLVGLAPGAPAERPPCVHAYGLPARADPLAFEAVTLRPGPHLAGGHGMAPVIRSMAGLAARLAAFDAVRAVVWHPARSWSAPDFFRESVRRWIEGGVFPGVGLTALALAPDGGMQSEGLALFTGQELRIEPELTADKTAAAKIGLRLIDLLAESGKLDAPQRITGPDGLPLRLEPSANGRFVRVWRG